VRLPGQVISVERAGHFDVRDDGVDFGIANVGDSFVRSARFQNLKPCVPKGIACEPSDGRVILDEEDARRVLSTHVATIHAKGQVPLRVEDIFVSFLGVCAWRATLICIYGFCGTSSSMAGVASLRRWLLINDCFGSMLSKKAAA
jgi:hypothetical protein